MYATEKALITAYLAGEKPAYSIIQDWIDKVIVHRTRGDIDARNDLSGMIHLELLVDLRDGKYRGDGILNRYVMKIAKYKCVDMFRAKENKYFVAVDAEAISPELNPEELAIQNEHAKLLTKALDILGSPCREIVVRKMQEGEKHSTIVEEYRFTSGYSRQKLLRCNNKLKSICLDLGYE